MSNPEYPNNSSQGNGQYPTTESRVEQAAHLASRETYSADRKQGFLPTLEELRDEAIEHATNFLKQLTQESISFDSYRLSGLYEQKYIQGYKHTAGLTDAQFPTVHALAAQQKAADDRKADANNPIPPEFVNIRATERALGYLSSLKDPADRYTILYDFIAAYNGVYLGYSNPRPQKTSAPRVPISPQPTPTWQSMSPPSPAPSQPPHQWSPSQPMQNASTNQPI